MPTSTPVDAPERLAEDHDIATFTAGPDDAGGQAQWLRRHALANDRDGSMRVFVTCFPGSRRVGAFYGLATAAIARTELPRSLRPHGTPAAVPAALIARLAV